MPVPRRSIALVRSRSLAGAFALAGALAFAGCASTAATPDEAQAPQKEEDEDQARKASVLQRKIEIAELELAALVARQGAALATARTELTLAESELETFREIDRTTRLGLATLDLRGATDRAQEAADELAQIQVMYEEQDLDDVTREFVINRGRRHAERMAERNALEERNLARLTEHTLPNEELKLALAVDRARAGLADAEQSNEVERRNKELALDDLRYELAQLQKKLAAKP
jgi:hypothetical protein